jgi:NCAIR mutase (PurE)-related protein
MAAKKKEEAVFCSPKELESRKTSIDLMGLITTVFDQLYDVQESYEVDGFTTFIQGAIEVLMVQGASRKDVKRIVKKFIHVRWISRTSPPGYPPNVGITQKSLYDLRHPDMTARIVTDVRFDGTTKMAMVLMEEIFAEILSGYTPEVETACSTCCTPNK